MLNLLIKKSKKKDEYDASRWVLVTLFTEYHLSAQFLCGNTRLEIDQIQNIFCTATDSFTSYLAMNCMQ